MLEKIRGLNFKKTFVTKSLLMQDTTKTIDIIAISFDRNSGEFIFSVNFYLLSVIFLLLLIFFMVFRSWLKKNYSIKETEFELTAAFTKTKFKVQRNTENLKIANRIYTELMTRKAAILFEEDKDVIKEVYDSWYNLFGIIRNEIKEVPGQYLIDHDPTEALIGLSMDILNEGLRPHLTTYQAKFRRWYTDALEKDKNKDKSPQEIQRQYPEYESLVVSMKEVNIILIEFAKELKKLIKGEERQKKIA